jgi:hypothetical protein
MTQPTPHQLAQDEARAAFYVAIAWIDSGISARRALAYATRKILGAEGPARP